MATKIHFTKMHGAGNDYIYVNTLLYNIPDPAAASVRWSRPHFGVGSDGLILIGAATVPDADFSMRIFNNDGSEAMMCGNGTRCVAKYLHDKGLTPKNPIRLQTLSGVKVLQLHCDASGKVETVTVDMGEPSLQEPSQFGVHGGKAAEWELTVGGRQFVGTFVSMGNPHCIVPVEDVDGLEIEKIGPFFERHPAFPARVNTEFIRVLDANTVQMRVWERGSGETLACGTGACAVAVACSLNGWTGDEVTVRLVGGDLQIRWDKERQTVFMTGPATVVFDGEIDLSVFQV